MRFGKREVRRRLTGLTLPIVGGGATWAVSDADKTTARSVLNFLEDRRVLYDPYQVELPHACVESVERIRGRLGSLIGQCQTPELRDPLRAIQAACRRFLTDVQAAQRNGGYVDVLNNGTPSWLFNQALGGLRAHVGISVALIIDVFDIEVDEHLGKILPPPIDADSESAERAPHSLQ